MHTELSAFSVSSKRQGRSIHHLITKLTWCNTRHWVKCEVWRKRATGWLALNHLHITCQVLVSKDCAPISQGKFRPWEYTLNYCDILSEIWEPVGNNYSSQETTLCICSCGTSAPQKLYPWPDTGKAFSRFPWEESGMVPPWPLLCVLFTAGWSLHHHSTARVTDSSLRATKLFYTSARIKVKWLQEDRKTARLHLTAAGCTQTSWQSLHGLGCFDNTEPRKKSPGKKFPKSFWSKPCRCFEPSRRFAFSTELSSPDSNAESCDPSTEASVRNKSYTQYLAIWSLKYSNSETGQEQHYSQAASLLLQKAKFWSFEYWEQEIRPGAGWKASLDVCWHLQQHEVCVHGLKTMSSDQREPTQR